MRLTRGGPISREKILLELIPDSLQLQITVRTELKGEQMSNLSWLIFAAVDALVKEWYNLNVRRIRPLPLSVLCNSEPLGLKPS